MATPRAYEAGQAADLLGIDVFDLGVALRDFAERRFRSEVDRIRDFEEPNFGRARALLRAAKACDQAWDEERSARMDAAAT